MADKVTYPEALDTLFKDFLDGKEAVVSANGLLVEGSMEGQCRLKYTRFWGLELFTPLKWNEVKLMDTIKKTIFDKKDEIGLSYTHTDNLLPILQKIVDETYTRAGRINPYGISSWSTTLKDNSEIWSVSIKYSNGNTVDIRAVETPKNN